MKRFILILALVGLVATSFGALKVAIVAGDAIGDRGFTDMAYIGIQEAQRQFESSTKSSNAMWTLRSTSIH